MQEEPFPRTAEELRRKLGWDVDYKGPSDDQWRMLAADGTVDGYLTHPSGSGYKEVLQQLRRYLRKDPGRPKGSQISFAPEAIFDGILEPNEEMRQQVVTRAMARLAAQQPVLKWIRRQLFGGRTLATRTARSLADKVALRHFPAEWFRRQGIPIIRHRSAYVPVGSRSQSAAPIQPTRIELTWKGKHKIVNLRKVGVQIAEGDSEISLDGNRIAIKPGSVLGEVHRVAVSLSRTYGWDVAEAVEFILTDAPPSMPAIVAKDLWRWPSWRGDHSHPIITLQIETYVSPNSVKRAYRRIQRLLMGKQAHSIGKDSLRLFEFVITSLEERLGLSWSEIRAKEMETGKNWDLPWGEIAELWNQQDQTKSRGAYTGRDLSRTFRRLCDDILYRPATPLEANKLRRGGSRKGKK